MKSKPTSCSFTESRNSAQISVTSQEDAVFMALCGDEAEAIVGRKTAMLALEREDILHPFGWKIMGLHTAMYRGSPIPGPSDPAFRIPDRQRHDETIGQTAQHLQKPPLLKVDQARGIVDDDTGHRQGAERFIHGENGRIRKRDTYGNDPHPPKG